MAIRTALTEKFGLEYPLVLAPMAGVSGGRLAATVSNAGALGLVGGGYGDPAWMRKELSTCREGTDRPWGVGLITWAATPDTVELALERVMNLGGIRIPMRILRLARCSAVSRFPHSQAIPDRVHNNL